MTPLEKKLTFLRLYTVYTCLLELQCARTTTMHGTYFLASMGNTHTRTTNTSLAVPAVMRTTKTKGQFTTTGTPGNFWTRSGTVLTSLRERPVTSACRDVLSILFYTCTPGSLSRVSENMAKTTMSPPLSTAHKAKSQQSLPYLCLYQKTPGALFRETSDWPSGSSRKINTR